MSDALLWDVVASRCGHSAGSGIRGRQASRDPDVGPAVCDLATQSPGEPHQVETRFSKVHVSVSCFHAPAHVWRPFNIPEEFCPSHGVKPIQSFCWAAAKTTGSCAGTRTPERSVNHSCCFITFTWHLRPCTSIINDLPCIPWGSNPWLWRCLHRALPLEVTTVSFLSVFYLLTFNFYRHGMNKQNMNLKTDHSLNNYKIKWFCEIILTIIMFYIIYNVW